MSHNEFTQWLLCAMVGTFLGLPSHGGRGDSSSIVGNHCREPGARISVIKSTPTALPSMGL